MAFVLNVLFCVAAVMNGLGAVIQASTVTGITAQNAPGSIHAVSEAGLMAMLAWLQICALWGSVAEQLRLCRLCVMACVFWLVPRFVARTRGWKPAEKDAAGEKIGTVWALIEIAAFSYYALLASPSALL
jgi:Na+-transporting methylmalonyl-CoA/oxaloacetate decarboxylase gamma subunit